MFTPNSNDRYKVLFRPSERESESEKDQRARGKDQIKRRQSSKEICAFTLDWSELALRLVDTNARLYCKGLFTVELSRYSSYISKACSH